jgi:hypothetical protein
MQEALMRKNQLMGVQPGQNTPIGVQLPLPQIMFMPTTTLMFMLPDHQPGY